MDSMGDLYAKVQKKTIPVPPNQPAPEELYSVAQDVTDECEYDRINRSRGISNNKGASMSKTTATELTDDQKCFYKNTVLILAILSLLVGIAAISLVFVFNNKIESVKTTLRLEENKSSMNLEVLRDVKNRTADLEQHEENNHLQINQLEMKVETMNKTLIKIPKNISDIQVENEKIQQQLQQLQQNFTNLLIDINLKIEATKWLTHPNGFQYRKTDEEMNWTKARRDCRDLGGDLASVGMRNARIRTFLGLNFLSQENNYWIGLKRRDDNSWFWLDNDERVDTDNEIWKQGEPNNVHEKCAEVIAGNSGVKANDERCNRNFYGICEKSAKEN